MARKPIFPRIFPTLLARTSAIAAFVALAFTIALPPNALHAQDFQWPWDTQQKKPIPREPVYRAPVPQAPPPVYRDDQGQGYPPQGREFQPQPTETWAEPQRSPICLDLERRLVQEGQSGDISRLRLPALREEVRKLDGQLHSAQAKLDKKGCYEYFLFSKTLRRTKSCIALSRSVNKSRRRLAQLEAERQRLTSGSARSRKDEIVSELARNRCGAAYSQEARRRNTSPFSGLWQDQDSGGSGYGNAYSRLPFATYRTLCVRLCDGYYFPVSFSTLPTHFERDAAKCQSKCVAPTELYYHQNPGAGVNDMVAFSTQEPYTNLKSAFRYRKKYVQGCSCKQAEFIPQSPAGLQQQGAIEPAPAPAPANTAEARRQFSPTR